MGWMLNFLKDTGSARVFGTKPFRAVEMFLKSKFKSTPGGNSPGCNNIPPKVWSTWIPEDCPPAAPNPVTWLHHCWMHVMLRVWRHQLHKASERAAIEVIWVGSIGSGASIIAGPPKDRHSAVAIVTMTTRMIYSCMASPLFKTLLDNTSRITVQYLIIMTMNGSL